MTIQLYNTKGHAINIKKGTAVARMVAANEVPETVVADGTVGALQTRRWAKEGHVELTIEERRKQAVNQKPLTFILMVKPLKPLFFSEKPLFSGKAGFFQYSGCQDPIKSYIFRNVLFCPTF